MPLTKEQSEEIKKQLLAQIENLPQENKGQIKEYISQLNEQQLEDFLKQNQIQIQQAQAGAPQTQAGAPQTQTGAQQGQAGVPAQPGQPQQPQCIFCSIIKNEIPSHKIAENKKSIAILEINPLTKGHAIVIPLEHTTIDKLPKASLTLAQKIAKKIKSKLKSEDIKIETSSLQGHAIINVVPLYKDKPPEKKKASEKELNQLQFKLETKTRQRRKLIPASLKPKKLPEISFRIP